MVGGRSHDCRGLPCSLEAVSRAGIIRRQRIRQNWGRWAGSLLSGVTLILGTLRKPAQQMDCRPPSFRDLQRVGSVEQAAPCPSNSQPHGDLRWTSPAHVLDIHHPCTDSVQCLVARYAVSHTRTQVPSSCVKRVCAMRSSGEAMCSNSLASQIGQLDRKPFAKGCT